LASKNGKNGSNGKVGRPTDYDPAICERVVELGREGVGRLELAAELDIAWATMLTWEREHPEFLTATTRARELSAGWWEQQGRLGINNRNFNAQAYSLQVRNRFPAQWRDKQEHEHTGSVLHKLAALPPGELRRIEDMSDDEIVALIGDGSGS
jgi:hypothetical protein